MGLVVELFKGTGRQPWRYRLVSAANGQTLVTSEGYLTRWNRDRAVRKAFPTLPVRAV